MSNFITTNRRRAAFEAEAESAALNRARLDAEIDARLEALDARLDGEVALDREAAALASS